MIYYCDSINGLDANPGTLELPLQTIAGLVAADAANPASIWRLKMDSRWKEQITVPRNGMTVESYGVGTNKPLLDASDTIPAGAWSKTPGCTFVYQAGAVITGACATAWVSAWESDVRMVRAASLAACDATAGSYFPSSDSTSPITLYIHPLDGTDPAANGKVYEYSARWCGLTSFSVTGSVVRGLWTRRNYYNNGSLIVGQNSCVYDCLATEGTKHNVYARQGSYLNGVVARQAYYTVGNLTMFVHYEDVASGNVSYVNCTADLQRTPNVNDTGFFGHQGVSGAFLNVSHTNCSAIGLNIGFSGVQTVNWSCNYCTATGCANAFVPDATYNLLQGCTASGTGTIRAVYINAAGVIVDIRSCNFAPSNAYSNAGILIIAAHVTLRIYDSVVSGTGVFALQNTAASFDEFVSLRNSFSNTAWYYLCSGSAPTLLTSDYNAFSGGVSGSKFQIGSTQYTYAAYKAATAQDSHSV